MFPAIITTQSMCQTFRPRSWMFNFKQCFNLISILANFDVKSKIFFIQNNAFLWFMKVMNCSWPEIERKLQNLGIAYNSNKPRKKLTNYFWMPFKYTQRETFQYKKMKNIWWTIYYLTKKIRWSNNFWVNLIVPWFNLSFRSVKGYFSQWLARLSLYILVMHHGREISKLTLWQGLKVSNGACVCFLRAWLIYSIGIH